MAIAIRTKSPCGAADLLAAIFTRDADDIRSKFGLPLKHPVCYVCGNYLAKDGHCFAKAHYVSVACSECGSLFKRTEHNLIHHIGEGQKYFFCSRTCHGRWLGEHYGFAGGKR